MRFWIAVLILGTWMLPGYCRTEVFIDLFSHATLDQADYSLGEIAAVLGSDPAVVGAIKRVKVGRCNLAAGTCQVSKSEVSAHLSGDLAFRDTVVIWGNNDVVAIQRASQDVPLAGVSEEIAIKLAQRLKSQGQVIVKILESDVPLVLPKGKVVMTPDFQHVKRLGRDVLEVPLNVFVDGAAIKSTVLCFRVAVKPGLTESAGNDGPGNLFRTGTDTVMNSQFGDAARGPLAITKDQHVRLIIESGQVTVETEGIALESGALGQQISVQRTGVAHRLQGRVLGEGTVLVMEQQG